MQVDVAGFAWKGVSPSANTDSVTASIRAHAMPWVDASLEEWYGFPLRGEDSWCLASIQ